MNRRRRQPSLVILAALLPVLLVLGIYLGGHPGSLPGPVRSLLVDDDVNTVQDALDVIQDDYYRKVSRDDLVNHGIAGAVARLGDRFSSYLDPAQYRRSQDDLHGLFSGVGLEVAHVPRGLRILRVFPRSPAERGGIHRGDLVLAVNGRSLAGTSTARSTALIRGRPGTTVALTILSDGTRRVQRVERARVSAPSVDSRLRAFRGRKLGVVALYGFTSGAHGQVRSAVGSLIDRGAKGIVLDLRGNGGGLIDEAVLVASIFIPDGRIVTTRGRTRPTRVFDATGGAIPTKIPVVVLVNRDTASASEIVTGALQDRRRAKVVGTHTFGKGVFQEVRELPNGGALDITVGEYFTPNGRNLGGGGTRRGAGVSPDIFARDLPSTRRDEALDSALRTLAAETR